MVYQPILNTLELKEDKRTSYVLSSESKGVDTAKLKPSYAEFLHSIKLSRYRIGIKFDKDPLAVEQNNYATKIVNTSLVYDLDAWPKNPLSNFKFKNSLFGATNILKSSDKEKRVYSGYGIIFDRAGSSNFGNDYVKDVAAFGVDDQFSEAYLIKLIQLIIEKYL